MFGFDAKFFIAFSQNKIQNLAYFGYFGDACHFEVFSLGTRYFTLLQFYIAIAKEFQSIRYKISVAVLNFSIDVSTKET